MLDPESQINRDFGTNDSFLNAQVVETTSGFADQTRYEIQGSMESLSDLDYYLVRTTPDGINGQTNMTVRLDSLVEDGFIPRVDLYDKNFVRVAGSVLVNSNGQLSVQGKNLLVDEDYYVRVSTNGLSPNFSVGDYRMTVDFVDESARFRKYASGQLTEQSQLADHSLHVAESQILHLNLTAFSNAEVPDALVWLTIYDEEGEVYFRAASQAGITRSANSILFSPGSYAVKVELALPDGISSSSSFHYLFRGRQISDSQGPKLLDPTDSPFDQCNPPSREYCYPNDNNSTDPFIFVNEEFVQVDPPETPWVDINKWYWFDDWLTPEVPPGL